jgi:hypothetical protein
MNSRTERRLGVAAAAALTIAALIAPAMADRNAHIENSALSTRASAVVQYAYAEMKGVGQ